MPFTLVDDPEPHGAALNMAIDEALLRAVRRPLLRCYRWARLSASLGYFGSWADLAAAWPHREWVRRWTGGGIVPHGEDFTYSIIVPAGHPLAVLGRGESYRAIHQAIARALELAGGCPPRLAEQTAPRISSACFENPAQGDLLIGPRKIAGAAQRRTQGGLLHQGSVLLATETRAFVSALMAALEARERRPLSAHELAAGQAIATEKYATREWLERR